MLLVRCLPGLIVLALAACTAAPGARPAAPTPSAAASTAAPVAAATAAAAPPAVNVDELASAVAAAVGKNLEGQLELTRRAETVVRQELDQQRLRGLPVVGAARLDQRDGTRHRPPLALQHPGSQAADVDGPGHQCPRRPDSVRSSSCAASAMTVPGW